MTLYTSTPFNDYLCVAEKYISEAKPKWLNEM